MMQLRQKIFGGFRSDRGAGGVGVDPAKQERSGDLGRRGTIRPQAPKIPDNSSTPPSKGQKANLPDRVKSRRGGRAGVSRALSEHPDRIIEATLSACPHCACVLGSADQPDTHAYDHIELPAISPLVWAFGPAAGTVRIEARVQTGGGAGGSTVSGRQLHALAYQPRQLPVLDTGPLTQIKLYSCKPRGGPKDP